MHNVCVVVDLGTRTGPHFIFVNEPYLYYERSITYEDNNGNTCIEIRIEFELLPVKLGKSTIHYFFPLQF